MAETFSGRIEAISEAVFQDMKGTSWHEHPDCPAIADLALICMNHWGMDGRVHAGELVVAAAVAMDVLGVFERLFAVRFAIAKMVRIAGYGGDDHASMADNNTSAFNFRCIAGTDKLSQHALGHAIDINPVQNPVIQPDRITPPAGAAYVDRNHVRPGMIVRPGPVTDAFNAIGWDWGGDWGDDFKDLHHFARYKR